MNITGEDKYGHYWIEILDGPKGKPVESYGWWPKYSLSRDLTGAVNTLGGVQGELNGVTISKGTGTPTRDPDHGKPADVEFHPRLMNTLTDQQVLDKIHEFVRSYKGEWRWTFGWGQNCRTFQAALMKYVGLEDPDSYSEITPPLVQAFSVYPLSLNLGEPFGIDYTVLDSGGSGLKRVELWRKDEKSDWMEIKRDELAGGDGPISGSFKNSPSAPGRYWYGLHVVDSVGNWNDEQNSNTYKPSSSFEPTEVDVKEEIAGPQIVASTTQGSESSVVGIWTLNYDWGCNGPIAEPQSKLIFNSDGTFLTQSENYMGKMETSAGKWTQTGNNVNWKYDNVPTVYDGTVQMDAMSGTMTISDTEITGCWSAMRGEAASKKVTLTLYVHDGSASGPLISGAQVTGQDGSGNRFQRTTDESGYVTIKGDPGTWHFEVSADGYQTNIWDQEITETDTKDAFLQKSVASTTQGSENSIVGTWRFSPLDCECSPEEVAGGCNCDPYEITFNKDGTISQAVSWWAEKWVQNGNTVSWEPVQGSSPIYTGDVHNTVHCPSYDEGIINENIMSGTVTSGPDTCPAPWGPPGRTFTWHWNAVRVDTEESGNQDESTTLMNQAGTPVNEGITGPRFYVGTILPDGTSITTSGIRGTMCDPPKDGRPV